MAAAAIVKFGQIENSAIRSAVPENPTLEQNMKWIGPNLGCSPWSRPMMFGSAESKHPRLTRPNGEIISDVLQPM